MLFITVTSDEWLMKKMNDQNVVINRGIFYDYLISIISPYLKSYEDCDFIEIIFPGVLFDYEREQIQKFVVTGLYTQLYYKSGELLLKVCLHKIFVKSLFIGYIFEESCSPEELLFKKEKEILFESLIIFIEKNLHEQHIKYINEIHK